MRIRGANNWRVRKGFLYSICIALFLISIIALPAFMKSPKPNKALSTKMVINEILTALLRYHKDCNQFPLGGNGEIIKCLREKDSIRNKGNVDYINFSGVRFALNANGAVLDEWGTPLEIKLDSSRYLVCIRSFGANKKDDDGKSDDIEITWPQNRQEKK